MYKTLKECRLCNSDFFEESLVLNSTPAANELYESEDLALTAEKFPLEVVMCKECKHLQLRHIVDPVRLFSNYIYKSGTSEFFRNHFKEFSENLSEVLPNEGYILEVGSNDGTLMKALELVGKKVIGIEPSSLLTEECKENGLTVIQGFLDENTVGEVLNEYGKPICVLGNNVFAHIDDIRSSFELIYGILEENGIFVFEVAHAINILKDGIFDTIYHEHMSYHTALAMQSFSRSMGFEMYKIEKISPHGGSLRFYLRKGKVDEPQESMLKIIQEEVSLGFNTPEVLTEISKRINNLKQKVQKQVAVLTNSEKVQFVGYGAPAKVVTFLSEMGLEKLPLIAVIDDNPSKQKKHLPASGFFIDSQSNVARMLDFDSETRIVILVFPWNLGKEILQKLKSWLPKDSSVITFFPQFMETRI